jgi:sugar phosphate isomerase/epimerase
MMKLGCSVWSLTGRYGPPFDDAPEAIAALGFEATELIVQSTDQMRDHFNPSQCAAMRDRLSGLGLQMSQFVVYKDMIDGLASMDPGRIDSALEIWEQGCSIARALGTDTINTVSHWIPGLTSPNPYPPAFVHVSKSPQGSFSPKISFSYPPFEWDEVWSSYVRSIQRCCDIAANYGLRFALEGHPHVIVSHTDSFLAFHKDVARENFGMNYDTGMQSDQREHVPVSIRKLGRRIFHLHVRDSDSLVVHQLPIGQGLLDWDAIVAELINTGYDGYLSIELGGYLDAPRWVRESRDYLVRVMDRALVPDGTLAR